MNPDELLTAEDLYSQETSAHRLLSLDDERDCIRRIHAGDKDALDRLVTHNQRLVQKIARSYHRSAISGVGPQKLEWMDLVQIGNIGLLHAVRKFDPHRKTRFSTYAVWWIRQYIRRYCVVSSGVFSISYRQGDVQATQSKSGLPFESIGLVYLDAPCSLDNDTPIEEIAAGVDGVEEDASNRVDYALILARILQLDERTQQALVLRFGLDGGAMHTYARIAALMGMSNVAAASVVNSALGKLRQASDIKE